MLRKWLPVTVFIVNFLLLGPIRQPVPDSLRSQEEEPFMLEDLTGNDTEPPTTTGLLPCVVFEDTAPILPEGSS